MTGSDAAPYRIPLTDHLTEPDHNPDYWNLVERAMPGYESQKTNLASVGKGIWLRAAG
jgi:predicted metal-dependent hydrolase